MNDNIMLFFLLNQYSYHCNVFLLATSDYVRFMRPLDELIVYNWLRLYKSLENVF